MSPLPTSSVDIIVASQRDSFWENIQLILKGFSPYKFKIIKSADEIINSTDTTLKPQLALVDGQDGTNTTNELVQSIKMTFNNCRIIVLHTAANKIDFNLVKKNGADEIMHLSYDREFISDIVLELAPIDLSGDQIPISSLMPVDLRDLEPTMNINFDAYVHLPVNHRSILIRKNGDFIEEKQIQKLRDSRQQLYIKKTQMRQFFEYARTAMTLNNAPQPISFTEKFHRSKKAIYEIMGEFLNEAKTDFSEGRTILEKCKSILTDFDLVADKPNEEIFHNLTRFCGNTNTLYHTCISLAATASSFAQLIDLATEKRESAALAGLLHNIGLSQLPTQLIDKPYKKMSPDEFSEFQSYPDKSVFLVKTKKVPLPLDVSEAIEQHRENTGGTGFPNKTNSDHQTELGRLLQISFVFVELTSIQDTKAAHTPKEGLSKMYEESIEGRLHLDIIILKKILDKWNSPEK